MYSNKKSFLATFEEKYYKQIFSVENIEKIVESEYFKCIKDLINDERE